MIIVSHRGNLNGPCELENHPSQISEAVKLFFVEIDVWYINKNWFLGHDQPQYKVNFDFFTDKMYIHCKNFEALEEFENLNTNLKYFWQTNENISFIRNDKLWCNYNIYTKHGITVELLYNDKIVTKDIRGICTDFPLSYLKNA